MVRALGVVVFLKRVDTAMLEHFRSLLVDEGRVMVLFSDHLPSHLRLRTQLRR